MNALVTGATGQLGRELVPRLLALGHKLTLVARDPAKAGRLFPGVPAARGDVRLEGFGLAGGQRYDALWHLAGEINLGSSRDETVQATNYGGTVNALEFCRRNTVPRLFYAGTAYTEKSRNSYEKSKKAAEELLEGSGLPGLTVFKLGILVSPEAQQAPEGALYQFVNGLALALDRSGERALRIKGDPGARLNLLHCDAAAAFMASAPGPGKFWVTHPDPVSLAELAAEVSAALGADIRFEKDFTMTRGEALLHRLVRPFLPYLLGDSFPSGLPGLPRVTGGFLRKSAAASAALFRCGTAAFGQETPIS